MVHDLALEPQPLPGALSGAAAGPAGRAVTAPHSATAAISYTSNTAGLAAAAPALARSYVRGEASASACRLPGEFPSAALNLFHSAPDKTIAWDIASLGE
jgi:hypothetical protein